MADHGGESNLVQDILHLRNAFLCRIQKENHDRLFRKSCPQFIKGFRVNGHDGGIAGPSQCLHLKTERIDAHLIPHRIGGNRRIGNGSKMLLSVLCGQISLRILRMQQMSAIGIDIFVRKGFNHNLLLIQRLTE